MRAVALPGGELEYAVLVALWTHGACSGREVHQRVGEPRNLVYTTTAKVLDRLFDKKLVLRKKLGNAFVYRANVKREIIEQARATEAVTRLLGAEPHPAMAALVSAVEAIDPQLLTELERLVAARRRTGRGS